MADFLFDGINKIISEPPGIGDTVFDVKSDIYSAWKRWMVTDEGALYPPAFSIEGGTPIGSTGLFTGSTYLLINGWKIRPANYDHQMILTGNLFSDDGIISIPAVSANATIFVSSSVNAQGVSTGSGATEAQLAEIHARLDNLLSKSDYLALS